MVTKKNSDLYTPEELKAMKEQWLKDKKRIDIEMEGFYQRDVDQEYQKYFATKNLQMLFRSTVRLYRNLFEGGLFLHKREKPLIIEVYKEMVKNGYYSDSKAEEKRVRAWLGKTVSRQTYIRYKKRR